MPMTEIRNRLYRMALPLLSPSSPAKFIISGGHLQNIPSLRRAVRRHHIQGMSLILHRDQRLISISSPGILTGQREPEHSLFRIASITKLVTALCLLRLQEAGMLSMDTLAGPILSMECEVLEGVRVRHLLSHTSGLQDRACVDDALREQLPLSALLRHQELRTSRPGDSFRYCNLGFGILGSVIEKVTGSSVEVAIREWVLEPLQMNGCFFPERESQIMPMVRVLPWHPQSSVTGPSVRVPNHSVADPEHHYGMTQGGLYTDAASLLHILQCLRDDGRFAGRPFLSHDSVQEMRKPHGVYGDADPCMAYGLGLLILEDKSISDSRILGHQGFAFGCVNGVFLEEKSGLCMVLLNGGCSEARHGRMADVNRDLLRYAIKELSS